MKSNKRGIIASLLIAGLLLCNNLTVFASDETEIDKKYYSGYYNLTIPYGFDINDETIYVKDSYTSQILWEAEKVEEVKYTNTIVYARYKPNMEDAAGPLLNPGTQVKLIGSSLNGWDIVEYDDRLLFIWYEYLSDAAPAPRVESTQAEEYYEAAVEESYVETPAPQAEQPQETSSNNGMTYMGCWEISAYEETGNCCANGNYPTVWYTCAFNEAPRGATIYIDGLGYFVNEDYCGTPGRLDIYLGDYDACIQFGIQYYDVYIVN